MNEFFATSGGRLATPRCVGRLQILRRQRQAVKTCWLANQSHSIVLELERRERCFWPRNQMAADATRSHSGINSMLQAMPTCSQLRRSTSRICSQVSGRM